MLFEKKFRGSRILRELRKLGFRGSKSALYRYLEELSEERAKSRTGRGFKRAPGEQGRATGLPIGEDHSVTWCHGIKDKRTHGATFAGKGEEFSMVSKKRTDFDPGLV